MGRVWVWLCLLAGPASGVDHSKFRTCKMTYFCKTKREAQPSRAHVVAPGTVSLADGKLTAQLHGGPYGVPLTLTLVGYDTGVARLRITETNPLHGPRWEPQDILLEQTVAPLKPLLAGAATLPSALSGPVSASEALAYSVTADDSVVVGIYLHPFRAKLFQAGEAAVDLNPEGRFYFDHHRKKEGGAAQPALATDGDDVHGGKTVVDYGEDGLAVYSDGTKQQKGEPAKEAEAEGKELDEGEWEESFGPHRDTKPFGPASVGMDMRFEHAAHVFGLAEHTGPLNLASTVGPGAKFSEPYRMWTLDVYDYELDSPMAIYGGVPLMIAHTPNRTTGVLWFNPTETFIDISREGGSADGWFSSGSPPSSTKSYWMSESGVVDVMLLPGPSPAHLFSQYAKLTGYTPLPPLFSLGYHQCRWNYNDEADVRYVHGQFESLDIPYDVLWLDIEHTDGKRYFTWDSFKFPKPAEMQEELAATGRKMVTIVDPHIKKDSNYHVYKEAHDKGLFIKNKDDEEFDGWCWPGASAYLDFTSEEVRDWWAGRFAYDVYKGSTPTLYTWNDMNEPSVFNGPEVSMSKDAKNLAGIEHREWHNLYGMYMQRATAEGLLKRNEEQDKRPFVLSRSFYAGTQRWGAIWTGDNACKWDHLVASVPMLLALGLCGITFSGADVGGFLGKGGGYGDPDYELFTRWFETGAYTPFFRGHAHHESARREPWTFGEETTARLREIAKERYQLLAYWYTTFHVSETTGMPTMVPIWVHYPAETATYEAEDQWLVGRDLLVHPVTAKGASSVTAYLPGTEPWYGVRDGVQHAAPGEVTVQAPLGKIPVFQRGGSIVPRQMRLRRSSASMARDPYTLVVAADSAGAAAGLLYLDAGDGYEYTRGAYALWRYELSSGMLSATAVHESTGWSAPNRLERIELLGVPKLTRVVLREGDAERELGFSWSEASGRVVVRKPDVPMAGAWTISLVS